MFARPLTGADYVLAKVGAIATIVFAFSFIPQVVLYVGNMLVSDSAFEYLREHLDVLWKVPVSVVLLAVFYAVVGVSIASLTDRRIVAGAAIIGVFLVTSIASGVIAEGRDGSLRRPPQRARPPAVPARRRVPRAHRPDDARSAGSATAGCSPPCCTSSSSPPAPACCCGATAGSSDDAAGAVRPCRARPGVRRRADRHGRGRVGVVRGEGRAVGAELLVRARCHRPARPERRRQDDADAGDDRHDRRQPGSRQRRGPRPAPRPQRPSRHGPRPRGRGGPGGADRPAARALQRRPAPGRRPRTRPTPRWRPSACSTWPTGASTASARACASG